MANNNNKIVVTITSTVNTSVDVLNIFEGNDAEVAEFLTSHGWAQGCIDTGDEIITIAIQ